MEKQKKKFCLKKNIINDFFFYTKKQRRKKEPLGVLNNTWKYLVWAATKLCKQKELINIAKTKKYKF